MPDAAKDTALNALVGAAFGASGQRCMAISVAVFVRVVSCQVKCMNVGLLCLLGWRSWKLDTGIGQENPNIGTRHYRKE